MKEESTTLKPKMSALAAETDGMKCAEDLDYVVTANDAHQNGIAIAILELETRESELETKDFPSQR